MNVKSFVCAGALVALALPALAQTEETAPQAQPVAVPVDRERIDVALDFLRDAEVVGEDGDEIGEVERIVRAQDGSPGLSLVFEIDNGWFEEDTQLVAPIGAFTIVDDDTLRIDNVTEITVGNVPPFVPDRWVELGDAYDTVAGAYADLGWER
jgi:hypothetical protein